MFFDKEISHLWSSNELDFLSSPFFFYQDFLHRHWDSQDSSGREAIIFFSILPLPAAHEHWDIYLQLCIWDDYHVFLMATLVFTRLLLDVIPAYRITIWVIDWWFNVYLFTWWIDTRFLLQWFDIGNRWIWTRIDYRPCITSEPTNQVCYSPPKLSLKISKDPY